LKCGEAHVVNVYKALLQLQEVGSGSGVVANNTEGEAG